MGLLIFIFILSLQEQMNRSPVMLQDDLNPSFLKDSPDEIIFSSNRFSDTLTNTGDPFEKIV